MASASASASPALPLLHGQKTFSMIAAATKTRGLGVSGDMAWSLPREFRRFTELSSRTTQPGRQNAVIMGRATYFSIPQKDRPLKNRVNIVVTRNPAQNTYEPNVIVVKSLEEALAAADAHPNVEDIHIGGGGQIYSEAILHPRCELIHYTVIDLDVSCDAFFPVIEPAAYRELNRTQPITERNRNTGLDVQYEFVTYQRIRSND